MMMDGYTITRERLTYNGAEPDMYDWLGEQVDPDPSWVLRREGRLVASQSVTGDLATWLERCAEEYGAVPVPDAPERLDRLVLADRRPAVQSAHLAIAV